ncbi:unnamed protein product [Periconia digitata]|uniref:Protein kinase domain-containing protein n=1 Tax=Periconia digitata TaxID=1303443 RepID=A0A9W4U703_9PLEO|nr:unnamed protein product [Periconia digitata]
MSEEPWTDDEEYPLASEDGDSPPGDGLMLQGPPTGLEKIYDYEPNGHHPLHLGDILNKRYKILHKLGSGGYANVWLCCDETYDSRASSGPRYLAVKVIMAAASKSSCSELRVNKLIAMGIAEDVAAELFCIPLDQFSIDGPNGTHLAFVYPLLGPRVSRLFNKAEDEDFEHTLRKLAAQVTRGMSALHARGICHGDFRPANILTRIQNLDHLSEAELFDLIGIPEKTNVTTASNTPHTLPSAPQYLVYPIIWEDIAQSSTAEPIITDKACIIDFGNSYMVDDPPPHLGIPQIYCAPEYTIEKKIGIGSDLWALGCTIFEIRTGRRLFDTFDDDPDENLWKIAMILGRYPEPWWSETWTARRSIFFDDVDEEGKVVDVLAAKQGEEEKDANVWQKPWARSLQEEIKEGLVYMFRDRPGGVERGISGSEVECLADLLGRLLRYVPAERVGAEEALKHAWFEL